MLDDDRPRAPERRPRCDREPRSTARPIPRPRWSRSTRTPATCGRWPRAARYADQQFNLAAQGHRQPGSAFKTFALDHGLGRGIDPDTTYYDSHSSTSTIPWLRAVERLHLRPQLRRRTSSLHDATLDLGQHRLRAARRSTSGPRHVAETAHDWGSRASSTDTPRRRSAGSASASRRWRWPTPTRPSPPAASTTRRSRSAGSRSPTAASTTGRRAARPNRVFSDGIACEVTQILEDNVAAGTGTAAGTGCGDAAGKTGTTDDYNDAMFVGYTPPLSTAVWVGYPDALQSMYSVHGIAVAGGTFPAEIWHDYMSSGARQVRLPDLPRAPEPGRLDPLPRDLQLGLRAAAPARARAARARAAIAVPRSADRAREDNSGKNKGAYAPGVGQKPLPTPSPTPQPAPTAASASPATRRRHRSLIGATGMSPRGAIARAPIYIGAHPSGVRRAQEPPR